MNQCTEYETISIANNIYSKTKSLTMKRLIILSLWNQIRASIVVWIWSINEIFLCSCWPKFDRIYRRLAYLFKKSMNKNDFDNILLCYCAYLQIIIFKTRKSIQKVKKIINLTSFISPQVNNLLFYLLCWIWKFKVGKLRKLSHSSPSTKQHKTGL